MRKLGKANIKSFIFFTFIVIFIIVIFAFGIIKVLLYDKQQYKVTSNSYLFDETYASIAFDKDGTIYKNWNGKYYLSVEGTKDKYTLGKETVVYDPNDYKMYIYGDAYQVFNDGKISKKSGQTEIIRTTMSSFYKLADRKYLIVDKKIVNEKGDFSTKNYLVVDIDKLGNALLINNEVSLKTINPMILKSADFTFDIANEKLLYNKKIIDLKKINGSTNQYVEEPENDEDSQNNYGGTGGSGGSISTGTSNSSVDEDDNTTQEPLVLQKRVGIRTITPSITYLTVDYSVIDPLNEYVSVFLLLGTGDSETKKIQLNKNDTIYQIRNLNTNTEYGVSIGYTYIDKENGNELVEEIQDVVKVRTPKPDYKLTITKVTSDKIYFNLQLDKNYNLESGMIALYADGNRVIDIAINPSACIAIEGWSSSLDFTDSGYEMILKLENAVYNGSIINTDVQAKYINY